MCVAMSTQQSTQLGEKFVALLRTRLPSKASPGAVSGPGSAEEAEKRRLAHSRAVRKRHSGVLGVSAIVSAHPYVCCWERGGWEALSTMGEVMKVLCTAAIAMCARVRVLLVSTGTPFLRTFQSCCACWRSCCMIRTPSLLPSSG